MDLKNEIIKHLDVESKDITAVAQTIADENNIAMVDVMTSIFMLINEGGIIMNENQISVPKADCPFEPIAKEVPAEGLPSEFTTTESFNPFEASKKNEVPKKVERKGKSAPYGIDKQVNKDGEEFDYIRSEFDGFATELDKFHKAMKGLIIANSGAIRDYLEIFCGAKDIAMTVDVSGLPNHPHYKFRNKDGKLFYRWNGQFTSSTMDQLWSVLRSSGIFSKEEVERVEALKETQ